MRIGNALWNGTVATGGTVSGVGFVGSYSATNAPPTSFAVNGVPCTGQPPGPQPVVSRTELSLTAGGIAMYTVRLSSPPTADVRVTSTRRSGASCITVASGTVSATSTVPREQRLIVEPATLVVDAVTNAYTIVLAMPAATDVLVTSTRIAGPDCIDVVSETNPWLFSPTDWFVPRIPWSWPTAAARASPPSRSNPPACRRFTCSRRPRHRDPARVNRPGQVVAPARTCSIRPHVPSTRTTIGK